MSAHEPRDQPADMRVLLEAQALVRQYFDEEPAVPAVVPDRIGDFRILEPIGRGGMGVVYAAEQGELQRRVALKILHTSTTTTPHTRRRFEREARVTAQLHHTNIVTVYAMGRDGDLLYFAMELVEGHPLDTIIAHLREVEAGHPGTRTREGMSAELRGPGAHACIARMFAEVADALSVAHGGGVIHRDIKPSNLILDAEGVLKLTDFGLARLVGEDLAMTRTGEAIGTPLYMSPEQVRSGAVDARTDVYSLGATLYELLTLERMHRGEGFAGVCAGILRGQPRRVQEIAPHVPRDLATIVEKATAPDRSERYATAGALCRDLRAFAEGRPIAARPIGLLGRQWRRVKRHKVRAALVGTVLLLAAVGSILFAAHRADQIELIEREYADLVRRAVELREDPAQIALLEWSEPESAGSDDEARSLLDRAIALRPEAPEAYAQRFVTGGLAREEGLEDLERARERGLPTWRYWVLRGLRDVAKKRPEEASHALTKATEAGAPAGDVDFAWLRIHVARRAGRHSEADGLIQKTLARPDLSVYDRMRLLVQRARTRMAHGDYAGAIEDLSALPLGGVKVRLQIAMLWGRLGNSERCAQVLEEVLADLKRTDDVEVWKAVCIQVAMLRQPELQDRVSREMLAAFPDAWQAKAFRAAYLVRFSKQGAKWYESKTGRNPGEEALQLIEEIEDEHALRVGWLGLKSQALKQLGRHQEALEILDEREALGDKTGRIDRASVLFEMDRHEEGIQLLRELAAEDPEEHAYHCSLQIWLSRLGRYEEAAVAGWEALRTDPHCRINLENQAGALFALGRWEECLEVVDSELAFAPTTLAHYRRVLSLSMLQRYAEVPAACAAYRAAGGPSNGSVEHCEVRSWRALGRRDEARKALERWKASGHLLRNAIGMEIELLRDEGKAAEGLALNRAFAQSHPGDWQIWAESEVYLLRELGLMEEARRAGAVVLAARDKMRPLAVVRALVTVGRVEEARGLIEATDWHAGGVSDRDAWPDLACAWSLVGDAQRAIEYLTKSAELGWRWSSHEAPDTDLAFVWDDPRFVELRREHAVAPLAPAESTEARDR